MCFNQLITEIIPHFFYIIFISNPFLSPREVHVILFNTNTFSIRMNTGDCSAHASRGKIKDCVTLFRVCFIRYFNNATGF